MDWLVDWPDWLSVPYHWQMRMTDGRNPGMERGRCVVFKLRDVYYMLSTGMSLGSPVIIRDHWLWGGSRLGEVVAVEGAFSVIEMMGWFDNTWCVGDGRPIVDVWRSAQFEGRLSIGSELFIKGEPGFELGCYAGETFAYEGRAEYQPVPGDPITMPLFAGEKHILVGMVIGAGVGAYMDAFVESEWFDGTHGI